MKREKMMRTTLLTGIFLILLFWSTGVALANQWHELPPTTAEKERFINSDNLIKTN